MDEELPEGGCKELCLWYGYVQAIGVEVLASGIAMNAAEGESRVEFSGVEDRRMVDLDCASRILPPSFKQSGRDKCWER